VSDFNRKAVEAVIEVCRTQPDPDVGYLAALAVALWALRDSGVSEEMLKLTVDATLGTAPSAEILALIRAGQGHREPPS
jgi:hypothetical protein